MADDPRIDDLLEELLDTNGTPEEVCRDSPGLLPLVRAGWQRVRAIRSEVGDLFPDPESAAAQLGGKVIVGPPQIAGYDVGEEVGHGGMGVVYKAWHRRLDRPVALKMLLAGPYARPEELQRFLGEAQAVAGLRHPNVVQVYDAGDLDGRPYFTMELVEGGSLAQKIAGVPRPAREAVDLLAAVADAVHSAHRSGVVHRDLKPANILLTADGTPKVTDFGLARRLEGDAGLTLTGVPMGTPSYMAPEQAEGEPGAIGPSTDVYSLGAILYELLTGRPPFRAETSAATLRQVLEVEPVPPARLNPGVPRDLQTICLKCLNKEPRRRYANSAALADDLRRFERGEPIAARPVGVAESLRKWVRRRPAAAGLLVAVTFFVAAGVAGALLLYQQRADARAHRAQTDREVRTVLARARGLLDEGWQAADPVKVTQARIEADRAADVARSGGASAAVRHEADAFGVETAGRLERVEKDRTLLDALQDISVPPETSPYVYVREDWPLTLGLQSGDIQYAAAFRRWGLEVDGTSEDETVGRLAAEPAPVLQELVAGLDAWTMERRRLKFPEEEWRRLFRVANRLDGNEGRRRLRQLLAAEVSLSGGGAAGLVAVGSPWPALLWELRREIGRRALLALRNDFDPRTVPAQTVVLLASVWADREYVAGAEQLLRQAVTARPEQAVLLVALGKLLERQGQSRLPEVIGYYRAARSRRPRLGFALGKALDTAGKPAEAEEVLQELVRLKVADNNPAVFNALGAAMNSQGKYGGAEAAYRQRLALTPHDALTHTSLGGVLCQQRRYADAEAACRRAIAIQLPGAAAYTRIEAAFAYSNLGIALNGQQRHAEAAAACRQAIALEPAFAPALNNLGNALFQQGDYVGAEAAYRRAIALQPDEARMLNNLGGALRGQGRYAEAEAAFRKAIALQPDYGEAYRNLGAALSSQQKYGDAESAHRRAIALYPNDAVAHYNLGNALRRQDKLREAEAAYRRAITLKPDFGLAHYNLGKALMEQGQFDEAVATLRKAANLPLTTALLREQMRELLEQCQRYAVLVPRLPAILQETEKPADAGEQIVVAQLCVLKKHYAVAGRFYRDAFAADPKLADDMLAEKRYNAARAATLAGCSRGMDGDKLDDPERARWRRQALDWLRDDLTWWGRELDKGNAQANIRARQAMEHWLIDGDLVGVRGREALARLSDEERRDWEKFWSDVNEILHRMSQGK